MVGILLAQPVARCSVRLALRDDAARPSGGRVALTAVVLAVLLGGTVLLIGLRPATAGVAWVAGAGVVVAGVDLLSHRIPDRVTLPAAVVCVAAFLADAAVEGTWPALLRAVLAGAVTFGVAALAAAVAPSGLGFGDVKLLGLVGLVLGWIGWDVLLAGVFLGFLTGAVVSLVLLATRRAGWRTALPFAPPLLVGAALALALQGPV
ncbi:prepilin peptidase [Blastococcus sp. PRF04-17]|uniref:prepilin peptidase n=1 Tax=Blastococcus sp. PRF04-17 TaxID=2933797 RepID=UPI001FF28775|nr:A24 family peptidase [Blastococcus sp. PRF04-17]UOY02780.1 A24 family peptidase [Blastococcus sp. PRF04-17]